MGSLCNCLVGVPHYIPGTHYVIRSSSLCGVKVLSAQNDLTRPPAVVTAKKKPQRNPGCLAHAVRGVFYCVVANRHQPNLYIYIPGTRYVI